MAIPVLSPKIGENAKKQTEMGKKWPASKKDCSTVDVSLDPSG